MYMYMIKEKSQKFLTKIYELYLMKYCQQDFMQIPRQFKDINFTYIENNHAFEDMYLMSSCQNNILANSSFAWWSAYINKNNNNRCRKERPTTENMTTIKQQPLMSLT